MNRKKGSKGRICMTLGTLLIAAALFLTAYNLWDDLRASGSAGKAYEQLKLRIPAADQVWDKEGGEGEARYPDYLLDPEMEMPVVEIDGLAYVGTLEIPALELSLPVLSQWSYPHLKLAPCRYTGSAYQDDLVIAAHNYSGHFGKLKELTAGDLVIFTDADGNIFSYEVSELEQLPPTGVEELEAGDWALSLFTCTVGGQYRVVVRCRLVP